MRHGTTEWNIQNIVQGQTDIPLHTIGIKEAEKAIIKNNEIINEITHVFYSPLKRASETAKIITQFLNCPKIELLDIQEWHLGDIQGKQWPEKDIPGAYKTFNPPNGETWVQFSARVLNALNYGLQNSELPLFVAHGGIRRVIADHLNIELPATHCELIKLVPPSDSKSTWSVVKLNFEDSI